jgi:hypothetical protein
MVNRLLFAATLGLAAPLAAQDAPPPPPDPLCPGAGRDLPRGPEWTCIGRLTRTYAFAFVYPAAAARIPALDAALREQAVTDETRLATGREGAAAEPASGRPVAHRYDASWRLDAAPPEVAAASARIRTFFGAAENPVEYRAILVDRRDDRPIALADLFRPDLFDYSLLGHRIRGMRAVQTAFCRAFAAAVRARQADPPAEVACPAVEDQPVTLVCGPRGRIEAMRALLGSGQWAGGPLVVDFPVDAEMIGMMKRRYRVAFGLPGERRGRRRSC